MASDKKKITRLRIHRTVTLKKKKKKKNIFTIYQNYTFALISAWCTLEDLSSAVILVAAY